MQKVKDEEKNDFWRGYTLCFVYGSYAFSEKLGEMTWKKNNISICKRNADPEELS